MTMIGSQQVEVTGHNRESTSRVVHYLRGKGVPSGQVEFQGGVAVTDDQHIIEDGKVFNVSLTLTEVEAEVPVKTTARPTPGRT